MAHPWRIALFFSVIGWFALLALAIVLDPTGGHGHNDARPPLWGWWIIVSIALPFAVFLVMVVLEFASWAFAGISRDDTEERIRRLERELGIK